MHPETITLRDDATGSIAHVLPTVGLNCYRFTAMHCGRPTEVLWAEEGFESGSRRASGSGIPLLFPFPGRIPGTTFHHNDRDWPLEAGDGRGNAIHGFVLNRPWRVVDRSPRHVTGVFQASVDDPAILTQWPVDFRLTATYRLEGNRLSLGVTAENPGDEPLPMGLGLHPYFRVPLGEGGANSNQAASVRRADDCVVRVPATEVWELVDMLATGKRLAASTCGPVAEGMRFADTRFDDVFAGMRFEGDWCTASISDPESGRKVSVAFDRPFRECVVYNPPHRGAICIEPYTCVPSACVLEPKGIDAGWRLLPPGATMTARMVIDVT